MVAARTTDPDLVAAAERGRHEVLDAMSAVDGVHIVVAMDQTVIARVRSGDGIHDVTRGHLTGWSCTCPDEACCHVAAIKQITAEAAS
jgi:hypothetical protein